MNKAKRQAVIAGNWKMNKTPAEAKKLIEELLPMIDGMNGCKVVLCVPYVDLACAVELTKDTAVSIGAQNVHFAESGAYTGEISAAMLNEIGVEYVIIGHSERREYFGETDATVNLRTTAALKAGLKVILCVGEKLEEREAGETENVIRTQMDGAFADIDAELAKNIIIAYEPVWAIGTGKTATPEQAEEVCAFIRGLLVDKYGADFAEAMTIQYGGSMNAKNADELLAKVNIDGGLIGGASLKAPDFTTIVTAAQK